MNNIQERDKLVFDVLSVLMESPEISLSDFQARLEINKEKLFSALNIVDSEKYANNIRFSRGGQGSKILIAFYDSALVTERGVHFMKNYTGSNSKNEKTSESNTTVFISYNWNESDFVDAIGASLDGKANVLRDKKDIPSWGSITEFMKSIRQQDFAILVISDAYLKSDACLNEVMHLMKDDNWPDKTMYIVMDDAREIYNPVGRSSYIAFWQEKIENLEKRIKSLPPDSTAELSTELKKSKTIQLNIAEFLTMVSGSNNPPICSATDEVKKRIASRSEQHISKEIRQHLEEAESIIMRWFSRSSSKPGYIIMPQHLLHLKMDIKNPKVADSLFDALRSLVEKGLLNERASDGQIELTQLGYDTIY